MTLAYCPVDDCCGGTIIRDNGMRAKCRTCEGRGVIVNEAPRVTVTHDGPPVVTPAPGQHVIVLDGLTHDEVRVITGLVRAMRESVVEARNAAPAEDAYGWLSLADGTLMDARQSLNYLPPDEVIAVHAAADTAWHIAHAISQMASGDEDASRVLGERGW